MSIAIETYELDERGRYVIPKDPNAVLDYSTDWRQWLAAQSDAMSSYAVLLEPDATINIDAAIEVDGVITAIISGGEPKKLEAVTFRMITPTRVDDRTIYLKIAER